MEGDLLENCKKGFKKMDDRMTERLDIKPVKERLDIKPVEYD